MEVHQHRQTLQLFQDSVDFGKGIVGIEIHAAAADEIHHGDLTVVGFIDPNAAAGELGREVRRAQAALVVVQIGGDLPLVPGVVAQSDHIGAGVEDGLALRGRHAHHGGILPVDHAEIDFVLFPQFGQMFSQTIQTGGSHHIADR